MLTYEKDSSITEVNNFEDFRIQKFNKAGQITSQEFSNRYLNKYIYDKTSTHLDSN